MGQGENMPELRHARDAAMKAGALWFSINVLSAAVTERSSAA